MTTGHGSEWPTTTPSSSSPRRPPAASTRRYGLPPTPPTTWTRWARPQGDVDGDGRTDLVVASDKGLDVFLQRNGTLDAAYLIDYYGPQEVHLADVNGDARLDLVVITLTEVVTLPGGATAPSSRPGRCTRRGSTRSRSATSRAMGSRRGRVRLQIALGDPGRGDGTWGPPGRRSADANDYPPGGLAVGDFNGDGRTDVAWSVPGSSTVGHVKVFAQTSAGTLAPRALPGHRRIPARGRPRRRWPHRSGHGHRRVHRSPIPGGRRHARRAAGIPLPSSGSARSRTA